MNTPKILFIYDGLGGGGKERRFVQLVKGLNDMQYGQLYLLMTRDVLAYKEIEQYNIKITYIQRSCWNFAYKYLKFINSLNPNIIQIWSDIPLFYYNIIRSFIRHASSVSLSTAADCNFDYRPLSRKILYLISYRWLDTIVGNSMAGLEKYRVPMAKQYCIYNGFDSSRLLKDIHKNIRVELKINTKFVVSMVARFTSAKDWNLFVGAACLVLSKRDDVTFLAVGDGETRTGIKKIIPVDLKERILFLGRRNDIESIFRETNVSLLCTNPEEHAEGVSNSILESCAFGVPVIATRGGGTSEILEDGQNGYIIEPHNKDELSQKINFLLDSHSVRVEMGVKAKKIYEEKFTLEKATRKYIQLFEKMSNKHP